jgi:hypothetical protein
MRWPACHLDLSALTADGITRYTRFQLQRAMSTNWWTGPPFPFIRRSTAREGVIVSPSGSYNGNILPFYSSNKAQEVRVNRLRLVFLTACKTRAYLPETDSFAMQRLIPVRGTPVLHVLVKDPCRWRRLSRC